MFSIWWVSISAAPGGCPHSLQNPQLPIGSAMRSLSRSEGEEGTVTGSPHPLQASVRLPLAAPATAPTPSDPFPPPARELSWLPLNSSLSVPVTCRPLGGTPPPRRNPTTSSDHHVHPSGTCTTWWPLPSLRPGCSAHSAMPLGEATVCSFSHVITFLSRHQLCTGHTTDSQVAQSRLLSAQDPRPGNHDCLSWSGPPETLGP